MDVEAELLKDISRDELEIQIRQKIEAFHGFLTRDVALRLIAKERGLLKEKERACRLADVPKGARKISIKAKVKRVWPVADYASGKRSRVVEVQDDSGVMPLVFWNDDIKITDRLRSRDVIEARGLYERNGELHFSYSGRVDVQEHAPFTPLDQLADGEMVHVRGIVNRIEGYDSFVHGMNTSRAFSFIITDGKNERRAVIWEEPKRGEKLKEGDEVLIEDGLVSKDNIDLSSDARILARRNMLTGEVTRLECEGEVLYADIGGKELTLERRNALRLLGVEVADDITLPTVVALKKDKLLNNRIALKIEDGQVKRCLH